MHVLKNSFIFTHGTESHGTTFKLCKEDTVENKNQPWLGGSVDWIIVLYTKDCRFSSQSGHIPRLRVQSPVGELMGGN